MSITRTALTTILLLFLVGLILLPLTPVRFLIANTPTLIFSGEITRDQAFSGELSLDVYRPASPGPHPVVVFFYGGSYQTGRRQDYGFVGVTLAQAGYLVVIPDYRKYPNVRFPDFVEDGAAAVRWAMDNAARFGGDPERLAVTGHSAGAHIAALLATDPGYNVKANLTAFVGMSGPYHFTPQELIYQKIFGPEERYPDMQASTHVDGTEPPMLLLYGMDDTTVGDINLQRFGAALTAVDACHQIIRYPGLDHIGTVASLSWVFNKRPLLGDMVHFLDRIFAGEPCPS